MTLGECYIVYDIDSDILLFDIERFIFDIERKKGLRYRIRYQSTISNNYVRYRGDRTSISTILFVTFDIGDFTPLISSRVTFDIEYLRYRYTISNVKTSISNEHSISKSSISNVTLDIEGPTRDIGHLELPPPGRKQLYWFNTGYTGYTGIYEYEHFILVYTGIYKKT